MRFCATSAPVEINLNSTTTGPFMNKYVRYLLLVLLAGNLCLVFYQQCHVPLDGDILSMLPDPVYARVLQQPFGISTLTHGETYAGNGRFTVHMFGYCT